MITLDKSQFTPERKRIVDGDVWAEIYVKDDIEHVVLGNSRGELDILPFYGQMIWDAVFDGKSLRMESATKEPKYGNNISDTYGCFAFHSGVASSGVPGANDDHQLHGEFSTARLDRAWLEECDGILGVCGAALYEKGDLKYFTEPSVWLAPDVTEIRMAIDVKNVGDVEIPVQYLAHINTRYVPNGQIVDPVPREAWVARSTVPEGIESALGTLTEPAHFASEAVLYVDDLRPYGEKLTFLVKNPAGPDLFTTFSTEQLQSVTRWILYTDDLQVTAFALPATCRPDGFTAAKEAGTLIWLAPGESWNCEVLTGCR